MPKKKKRTVSVAKKDAWKAFSEYIRLRDAIKTTKSKTRCRCITCGNVYPIAWQRDGVYTQAGHAIDGRAKNILFDEDLVNGQCSACNCVHNGRLSEYALIMLERYGKEWFEEKCRIARLPAEKPWNVVDLDEIRDHYKAKKKELEDE
mgnify:CR=1 FL=1|jgi:hypothetical protein